MDNQPAQNQQTAPTPQTDTQHETAVPYTAPPPPITQFKSPVISGLIIAVVVLFGGFMTYNFISHQLTQLAGDSDTKIVKPTPSVSPIPTVYQGNAYP